MTDLRAGALAYAETATFTLVGVERPGLVVALHGLGATRDQPRAYLEGFDMPGLGLLAPDLRGHGETALMGEPGDFTPAQLGWDIEALVERLGLGTRRVFLLGISLGATVALDVVRRARLDIAAAAFVRPAHDMTRPQHLRVNASIATYLREDPGRARERLMASDEYREVATVSERAAASLRGKATAPRASERALRLSEGATWIAFGPGERIIHAPPSLIVAAADDPLHPLAVAREWHRRIVGSSLARLPSRDVDPVGYEALSCSTVQGFLARVARRSVPLP